MLFGLRNVDPEKNSSPLIAQSTNLYKKKQLKNNSKDTKFAIIHAINWISALSHALLFLVVSISAL